MGAALGSGLRRKDDADARGRSSLSSFGMTHVEFQSTGGAEATISRERRPRPASLAKRIPNS